MTKKFIAAVAFSILAFFAGNSLKAQNAVVQEGEFGFGVGCRSLFRRPEYPRPCKQAQDGGHRFLRKNFGNYIALRVGVSFAQLGYSDQYNSYNTYMYSRNLSFNTKVWELALQGDFNFFRFMPGEPQYNFTPYITIGAGVFSYDPYAYLRGEKIFLRPLGTEGQGPVHTPIVNNTVQWASAFLLAPDLNIHSTKGSILVLKYYIASPTQITLTM
jgi:hypothetical protein